MKSPTIINMSLSALKDLAKARDLSTQGKSIGNEKKMRDAKCQDITENLIYFVKSIRQQKSSIENERRKQTKLKKQELKEQINQQRQDQIHIPIPIADSVQLIIRKYLLYIVEEKQQNPMNHNPKLKLSYQRCGNIKQFLHRSNKENSEIILQQNDKNIFRSIQSQKINKQKMDAKNQDLQNQLTILREKIKYKNDIICKLLNQETQLRRKYNDQIGRFARSRNIYQINSNFSMEEQEGEGRNCLNITGKKFADSLKDENEELKSFIFKAKQKNRKMLGKPQSSYLKGMIKQKSSDFPLKQNILREIRPTTQLSKSIDKTLQNSIFSRGYFDQALGKPHNPDSLEQNNTNTFEFYLNSPQNNRSPEYLIDPNESKSIQIVKKMNDEQFQALEMKGFYNEQQKKDIQMKI